MARQILITLIRLRVTLMAFEAALDGKASIDRAAITGGTY